MCVCGLSVRYFYGICIANVCDYAVCVYMYILCVCCVYIYVLIDSQSSSDQVQGLNQMLALYNDLEQRQDLKEASAASSTLSKCEVLYT